MKLSWHTLIGLLAGLGFVILICLLILRSFQRSFESGLDFAVQHKAAKHAPGTVLSISKLPRENTDRDGWRRATVCLSIDSFADVAAEERSTYEAAEKARRLAEGPRCETFHYHSPSLTLRAGDHLEIVYLLENEGNIDINQLDVAGQTFYPDMLGQTPY